MKKLYNMMKYSGCCIVDDDRGMGVVEIIIILVLLIILVAVFREQITSLIYEAFSKTEYALQ